MFIFDLIKVILDEHALKEFVKDSEAREAEEQETQPKEIQVPNFNGKYNKINSTIIEKTEHSIQLPVSKSTAFMIANKSNNLKTDFCKNDDRHISYLSFHDYNINQINYNNEPHWHIEITKGDISWIEDCDIFSDGFLVESDFKKLQCLININTGEYLYFPQIKQ